MWLFQLKTICHAFVMWFLNSIGLLCIFLDCNNFKCGPFKFDSTLTTLTLAKMSGILTDIFEQHEKKRQKYWNSMKSFHWVLWSYAVASIFIYSSLVSRCTVLWLHANFESDNVQMLMFVVIIFSFNMQYGWL